MAGGCTKDHICLLSGLLFGDRRLSPALCLSSTSGPTGACVSRSRLASSLVIASYSSQSTYNIILTCKLPHRRSTFSAATPRSLSASLISVCIRPHSTRFGLPARIYTFVHLCVSNDPTMNRNLVQDGKSPSIISNRVVFRCISASIPLTISSIDMVIHCISLGFSEENWDDDFEFGGPSPTNSPVQSTRRRSIPSPPHSPPRAHKHTKSRGNGINSLSLTTSPRTTRWSAGTGGLDDENWDEDEPPVVQSRASVSREQTCINAFVVFLDYGSRPTQCPLSCITIPQGSARFVYLYLATGWWFSLCRVVPPPRRANLSTPVYSIFNKPSAPYLHSLTTHVDYQLTFTPNPSTSSPTTAPIPGQ